MSKSQPTNPPLDTLLRTVRLVVFDFDGVFTDNSVFVFEDGREAVRCTRADGLGIDNLRRLGIPMCIVSTETNPVVSARAKKLKLPCLQAIENKRVAVEQLAREHNIALGDMAFLGNDINDRPALELVGLPVVVADAHPDVKPLARYVTQRPGGHGAVREFCDLLAAARRQGVPARSADKE